MTVRALEETLSRALARAGIGALAGSNVEIRRPKPPGPDGAWLHQRRRGLPAILVALLALWNAGFVFQWGLNIVPSRGPVDFRAGARNQVTVVPARLLSMSTAPHA